MDVFCAMAAFYDRVGVKTDGGFMRFIAMTCAALGGLLILSGTASAQSSANYNSGGSVVAQPQAGPPLFVTPSYSYNDNNSFTNFGGNGNSSTSIGIVSPEQATALRRQREAQAAAYQRELLSRAQTPAQMLPSGNAQQLQAQPGQQAQANAEGSSYQGRAFEHLYAGEEGTARRPVQRRVLYKELNNPLAEPPRLFNLDR